MRNSPSEPGGFDVVIGDVPIGNVPIGDAPIGSVLKRTSLNERPETNVRPCAAGPFIWRTESCSLNEGIARRPWDPVSEVRESLAASAYEPLEPGHW